jgi:hypothetical protein
MRLTPMSIRYGYMFADESATWWSGWSPSLPSHTSPQCLSACPAK